MTHTPGPWRADLEAGAIALNGSAIYTVRDICSDDRGFNPADVELMAAAPEMLAALKQAVHALNVAKRFTVGATNSYAIATDIDRAIAKAEGRQ